MRGQDENRASGSTGGQPDVQPGEPSSSRGTGQGSPGASGGGTSYTQPTIPDNLSDESSRTAPPASQGFYQDILLQCDNLVQGYRKGEKSKASVYVNIQSKLFQALGKDRERSDAAFESFIATIESHDSELEMAARRAATAGARQRSSSPVVSDADGQRSDDEPVSKKPKPDESEYAWVAGGKSKAVPLSESLSKTLVGLGQSGT